MNHAQVEDDYYDGVLPIYLRLAQGEYEWISVDDIVEVMHK